MLEMTGTIRKPVIDLNRLTEEEAKNEQVLDTLKVERERGITASLASPGACATESSRTLSADRRPFATLNPDRSAPNQRP